MANSVLGGSNLKLGDKSPLNNEKEKKNISSSEQLQNMAESSKTEADNSSEILRILKQILPALNKKPGGPGGGQEEGFGDKLEGFLSDKFGELGDFLGDMKSDFGAGGSASIALQAIQKTFEAVRSALSTITNVVQNGIDQSITNQKNYLGPISSRLQSFTDDSAVYYKNLSYDIKNVFTASKFIDQQKLLANLGDLVKEGIGYNLEDRAYLATIADRTVSTFNVLDAGLTRMIKLQQSDLTRPQMGLEAYLTQGLNALFQDTSYLNSMYDSVTSALIDATSQMSYEQTTGYLYNVQKWLGSLYSVGISDSAINTIVQGLNYLGSGNVSQLTGNDTLNTLFAMSAQKAGLSYAQLLTTGVSEENVDKLLRSMIEYLQSIAENTSSEVLRNEYGRIFGGFSVSDLRAIQNLTTTDIEYIDTYKLDYKGAMDEVAKQITEKLVDRTSVAEQVGNMINNLIYSVGSQIAEDESIYTQWMYSNLLETIGDAMGGVIPMLGGILSSGVGMVAEAIKVDQIEEAIMGRNTGKALDMFMDYEFNEALDTERQKVIDTIEDTDSWLPEWLLAPNRAGYYQTQYYIDKTEKANALKEGLMNIPYWAVKGADSSFAFDNWQQFIVGGRASAYASNLTLAENAFAESEAKIKAASEEITGIDDTLSQSLDDIYDGLFGNSAKPIKVMLVDVDGNLLNTTTTTEYASNFDIEENVGTQIFKLMPSISSIE